MPTKHIHIHVGGKVRDADPFTQKVQQLLADCSALLNKAVFNSSNGAEISKAETALKLIAQARNVLK